MQSPKLNGGELLKKYWLLIIITFLLSAVIIVSCGKNNSISDYEKWETSLADNTENITVLIDINEKRLYAVQNDHILKEFPIATGKPDTPSPLGDFAIIQKTRWGEGFGAAWLGLNVPWGTYGIHGTIFPGSIGYAESHGCIRMMNKDVNELYKLVRVGTPVKIISGPYGLLGNGYRTLIPGDRGSDVCVVQKRLKELGFYKWEIDGIYGLEVQKALNNFEASKKLPLKNKIGEGLYKELGIILLE